MRQLLLDHVLFVEQFFGLLREFRLDLKEIDTAYKKGSVLCAFDKCWGIYRSCRIMIYRQSDGKQFYKRSPLSRVDALSQLKLSFGVLLETSPLYVEKKVNQELMSDEDCNLSSQLSLLEKLDLAKTTLDLEALFRGYCERLFFSADCLNFALSIKKVFPNHIDYLESEFFNSLIVGYLEQELGGIEGSEIDELDSTSKELCKVIPELECEPIIYEIKKASQEYSEYIESQIEEYYGEESHHFYNNSQGEDAWKIDNLFDTMKE